MVTEIACNNFAVKILIIVGHQQIVASSLKCFNLLLLLCHLISAKLTYLNCYSKYKVLYNALGIFSQKIKSSNFLKQPKSEVNS